MKNNTSPFLINEIVFSGKWHAIKLSLVNLVIMGSLLSLIIEVLHKSGNQPYHNGGNVFAIIYLTALLVSLASLGLYVLASNITSIPFDDNPSIQGKLKRSPAYKIVPWLSMKSYQLTILALIMWLVGLLVKTLFLFTSRIGQAIPGC